MDELTELGSSNLFHEGILYVDRVPVYIVEYYDDGTSDTYVSVFNVAEVSRKENASREAKKYPRKAYEVRNIKKGFAGNTVLSDLAAKIYKPKEYTREVDKPPMFVAPIQYGKDTFQENEGMGFYERTKDRFVRKTKGSKDVSIEPGNQTGVFISLDSIDWRKKSVPTNDIINSYQSRKSLWSRFM